MVQSNQAKSDKERSIKQGNSLLFFGEGHLCREVVVVNTSLESKVKNQKAQKQTRKKERKKERKSIVSFMKVHGHCNNFQRKTTSSATCSPMSPPKKRKQKIAVNQLMIQFGQVSLVYLVSWKNWAPHALWHLDGFLIWQLSNFPPGFL